MDSAILAVPARPGAPTDLGSALEQYITRSYDQPTEQYAADCRAVAALRESALTAIAAANPGPVLAYTAQLARLAPKFPGQVAKFSWKSSLGYTSGTVIGEHLAFDALNFEYNLGSIYTRIAANSQDYKVAFHQFQLAAGAFKAATVATSNGFTTSTSASASSASSAAASAAASALPRDLDRNTLHTLSLLCIAQAQECLWAKQRDDGRIGHLLLAKLAAGAAQEYSKCAAAAAKSSVIKAEWIDHIHAKAMLFAAIADFRAASHALEQNSYGEQVARLARASSTLESPLGKYLEAQVAAQVASLRDRVRSDLSNATKENDLIYMKAVPSNLPPIEAKVLAAPQSATDMGSPESLFTLLLPFSVYQTPAAYFQRLQNYLERFLINDLEELIAETTNVFSTCGLPAALDLANNPTMVPNSLLQEAEIIKQQGGIETAQSYLDETLDLAQNAAQRLKALPSTNEQVKTLANHLETASRSDKLLQEDISKYQYLVEILCRGHAAIEMFLPASSLDSDRSDQLQDVRAKSRAAKAIADQLFGLQTRCKNQISQYRLRLKTIDFSTPINRFIEQSTTPITEREQLEPVYNAIVSKFDPDIKELEYTKSQQRHLLVTLEERFTMFRAANSAIENVNASRKNQIEVLQSAAHEYHNIRSNLTDGREFYNKILSRITDLESEPTNNQWSSDIPISFA